MMERAIGNRDGPMSKWAPSTNGAEHNLSPTATI
jgi:hypothetical protein